MRLSKEERDAAIVNELVDAVSEALHEQEKADRIIGPSMRRMAMAQSHVLLDHTYEDMERWEADRPLAYDAPTLETFVDEFQAIIGQVQRVVSDRIKARLLEILRREVREAYQGALDTTDIVPINLPNNPNETDRAPENGHDLSTSLDIASIGESWPNSRDPNGASSSNGVPTPGEESEEEDSRPPEDRAEHETPPVADGLEGGGVAEATAPSSATAVAVAQRPQDVRRPEQAPPDDEIYEGTVRLNVEPGGGLVQVIRFVDGLRRRREFRLLQMVGARDAGVEIWLGLREPLGLTKMLLEMEGVSWVGVAQDSDGTDSEPLLTVRLLEPVA